eukprot:COSAG02_NODE_754_length_17578_cov_97.544825_16_plen_217_part_00
MLARALGGIHDIDAPQEHVPPRPIASTAGHVEPTRLSLDISGEEPRQERVAARRTLHETSSNDGAERALGSPWRRGDGRDVGRLSSLPGELKALAGLSGHADLVSGELTTARRRRQAALDSTGIVAPVELEPQATESQLVPPWGDLSSVEEPDRTDRRPQPAQRPRPAQTAEMDTALGADARSSHFSRERRLWDLQTWSGNAANAISLERGEAPRP